MAEGSEQEDRGQSAERGAQLAATDDELRLHMVEAQIPRHRRQHASDHAEIESEDEAAQCGVGRDADEHGRRHRQWIFLARGKRSRRCSRCRLGRTAFFTLQFCFFLRIPC